MNHLYQALEASACVVDQCVVYREDGRWQTKTNKMEIGLLTGTCGFCTISYILKVVWLSIACFNDYSSLFLIKFKLKSVSASFEMKTSGYEQSLES